MEVYFLELITIVAERGNDVKMFDPSGHFIQHFSVPSDDGETWLYILDVATDNQDNIYVLVKYRKENGYEGLVVYEFSNTAGLHHKFPVREESWGRLTVTNSQVLVLSGRLVSVYDTDGLFVRSFGEGTLKLAIDIAAANDGRVMVVDGYDSCVHIFSEDGDHLKTFKLQGRYSLPRTAFHRRSENVVIAGRDEEECDLLHVVIFSKDGDFVRSIQIHEERIHFIAGMTVTMDGRIAVLLSCEVLVI